MTPIQQMLLGAGGGEQIVTDNLELFYDFGNTSCYNNTENHTSPTSNRVLVNNLAKSAHSGWMFSLWPYGLNYNGPNQSSYYLARIDALLDYIYKLETCIESKTDIKLNKKYGKKYPKRNVQ